jgi:hypothetical protein
MTLQPAIRVASDMTGHALAMGAEVIRVAGVNSDTEETITKGERPPGRGWSLQQHLDTSRGRAGS